MPNVCCESAKVPKYQRNIKSYLQGHHFQHTEVATLDREYPVVRTERNTRVAAVDVERVVKCKSKQDL